MILLLFSSIAFADNRCNQPFEKFLATFENSRAFQMENTVFPLQHTFVDGGAYPEPKVIKTVLSRQLIEDRKAPIYPYPGKQENVPFVEEIAELSASRKQVMLHKPGTDYVLRYQFEIIDNCWRLTEYNNDSL